jgi:uncharacterized tellurite resistance protein B-like protein
MGLFERVLGGQGSESMPLDRREAFTTILLVTVAADGHVSDEEAESVIGISNRMKLYQGQSAEQFNAMMRKLVGLLRKHGPDALLAKACEALPTEYRESAFAASADLIFADGSIEREEKQLVERLQSALHIPDELALKIVEVMAIKNRG